jgi:hypothetical protein
MKLSIHFLISFLIFLVSCTGGGIFSSSKKSTKKTATDLQEEVSTTWSEMIQADDRKISDIKRLLQEISYTKEYNQVTWAYINSIVADLPAKRYAQSTMTNNQIDQYDLATDQAIKKTFDLLDSTSEMHSHPLGEELKEDIQKADNDVVVYRIKYDISAKKYNAFIQKKSKSLSKLGEPYSGMKTLPLFELPN